MDSREREAVRAIGARYRARNLMIDDETYERIEQMAVDRTRAEGRKVSVSELARVALSRLIEEEGKPRGEWRFVELPDDEDDTHDEPYEPPQPRSDHVEG